MQAVILALLATTSVQAEALDKTKDSFEICMQGVLKEKPGQIVKVEKKLEIIATFTVTTSALKTVKGAA